VRSRLEDLSPSQQPRAEAWLGVTVAAAAPPVAGSEADDDALVARAEAIPERWRKAAGVNEALALLRGELSGIPPVAPKFGEHPVLDAANRITPVETLDELIDVCAAVLENMGPPEEIERMLDGISRLCGERPEDFERRTGPMAKRVVNLIKRVDHCKPYLGFIHRDLPELALAWTRGEVTARGKGKADLTWFPGHRILEIARRAAARKSALLLAAPTHLGGWIDPREFVRRLLELQSHNIPPPPYDTIQALLRLAPDHRAEALDSAEKVAGEVGEAARYALGADGIPIGPTAALWIAAARARAPRDDDAALETRHPGMGPDAGNAARAVLTAKRKVYNMGGKDYPYVDASVKVEPPPPKTVADDLPTVMFHTPLNTEPNAITTRRWLATIWPACREAWFEEGVRLFANNLDWVEAEWQNRTHLEPLLEPDTTLGPMGLALLGLGLAAKEAGESGLATDAAISALRDGRLTGTSLGATLASLLALGMEPPSKPQPKPGGMITASRWAKTLAEVARASPLHAAAVHIALQSALGGQPSLRPADLAALLELLHELSVQLGASIDQTEARSYLEAQKGGGKGGKLAKALLALQATDQSVRRREAARLVLEGRIERAERWSVMADAAA
jgi:hypothetical protein